MQHQWKLQANSRDSSLSGDRMAGQATQHALLSSQPSYSYSFCRLVFPTCCLPACLPASSLTDCLQVSGCSRRLGAQGQRGGVCGVWVPLPGAVAAQVVLSLLLRACCFRVACWLSLHAIAQECPLPHAVRYLPLQVSFLAAMWCTPCFIWTCTTP